MFTVRKRHHDQCNHEQYDCDQSDLNVRGIYDYTFLHHGDARDYRDLRDCSNLNVRGIFDILVQATQ